MSEALKNILRTIVEDLFGIVSDSSLSEAEKVAKLERTAAAIASAKVSDAAIQQALKFE